MAALMRGALSEGLTVNAPWKVAVHFRQRIYQLREAMRKSDHEKYSLVARVRVTIELPEGCESSMVRGSPVPKDRNAIVKLVLRPNDSEFDSMLGDAGLTIKSIDVADGDEGSKNLEDLLRDLEAVK
jgi:hypothetical protein